MNDLELIKKGFNAGYLLQKYDPGLAKVVLKSLKDQDIPYAQGYKAGVKEYTLEQKKEQYRNQSVDRSQDQELNRKR